MKKPEIKTKYYLIVLFLIVLTKVSNAQVTYTPMYQPMSHSQMEAIAKARAKQAARDEANYKQYRDKAISYGMKGDYEACIYYANVAYRYYFTDDTIIYYEGLSYFKLGKKSKYKKAIRKALKFDYLETARKLKSLGIKHK
ncbi:hypothetical protein [Plebeiibacterium marinum]|uniref:Tetratricopeptide repeat protein n=1 Tax=Plebeiibacterium marinum TaxID=2992111 RepID=A0AAE3SL45_9BACT|nr:hypothetical protein [Plebeiobacterium marinum]MCW3806185.1 hypothetical protein [Plebeiobacterium marinum]